MSSQLVLGAPGVYERPAPAIRELTGVRMDVAAFAGVAPRGPAFVPVVDERWRDDVPCVEPERPRARSVAVAVESWDDYQRVFGGFEGPGLLPYAVASFFEQGGRRAYVVRVVPPAGGGAEGVARAALATVRTSTGASVDVVARSEGTWGNGLRATLSFTARPLAFLDVVDADLLLPRDAALPPSSLLRLRLGGGTTVFRIVTDTRLGGPIDSPVRVLHAILDLAPGAPVEAVDVVEGALDVDDGEGRRERHDRLGLVSGHRRWLATVLCTDSELLWPAPEWAELDVRPASTALPQAETQPFTGGRDRWSEIVPEDFFADDWVPGDDPAPEGLHALVGIDDVSLLLAPDLYSPAPLAPVESVLAPRSLSGPEFERCDDPPVEEQFVPTGDLDGLRLDPTLPPELDRITGLQQRLVGLAEDIGTAIALLDVPPGLHRRQILAWRARFASAFAAAYHPWLRVSRLDDLRDALVRVNPSALAAGIVARREQLYGVQDGPANELALGVVALDDAVGPQLHDELHPQGINVFLRERDGVRLTAARTLSTDLSWRQLSVRRLVTMIERVLEQEMQWAAFEPNDESLRAGVTQLLTNFLRRLFRANAFAGATEERSFFVRCDDELNPQATLDEGMLVAEVGVAPAEPLEFVVLRIARDSDGTVRVEPADV